MASPSPAQRVVVTGSAGFVGSALVRHLHAAGRDVLALSRADRSWPAGIRYGVVASYEDVPALAPWLDGADVVVHLAARAHTRGAPAQFEGNVRAATGVAQASRAAGVRRLVFLSSIGVNGSVTHGAPFTEADPPKPVEPYAVSKLRSEEAIVRVLAGGATSHVLLRPPLVYGPRAPGNLARLLHAVRSGWPLPFGGLRNARSLIGIGNLLDLVTLCLQHPAAANELFVVADGQDVSTADLVRHMARGLGQPARLAGVPPWLLASALRASGQSRLADSLCGSLQVDASKARNLLGWVPRQDAAEGIAQAARESARPC